MEFSKLSDRAIEIRGKYAELEKMKYGREWTPAEIAQGFVGDVGELIELVMAKSGIREKADVDAKLAHELADCLWCVLVLARKYDIDIEQAFVQTMSELDKRIDNARMMQ